MGNRAGEEGVRRGKGKQRMRLSCQADVTHSLESSTPFYDLGLDREISQFRLSGLKWESPLEGKKGLNRWEWNEGVRCRCP